MLRHERCCRADSGGTSEPGRLAEGRLREFVDQRWGDAAPRTRKKVRAVLMSFFKWAQIEFKVQAPTRPYPLTAPA